MQTGIVNALLNEWTVVSQAPVFLLTTLGIGFGLGFAIARRLDISQLNTLREQNAALNLELEVQELEPQERVEAPKDQRWEQAKQILERYEKDIELLEHFGTNGSNSKYNHLCPWAAWTNQDLQKLTQYVVLEIQQYIAQNYEAYVTCTGSKKLAIIFDYQAKYLAITKGLRTALLSRLSYSAESLKPDFYANATDIEGIQNITKELETLAMRLPL